MADLPESLGPVDEPDGPKRKRDENGAQHRAKRNRYISIACNECKRRKIKCNGEAPCQRCGNLNLECLYAPNCCNGNFKDTNEFRHMTAHLTSLQDQVDHLFNNLNSLRSSLGQDVPPHHDPSLYSHDQTRSISAPEDPMSVDSASQQRTNNAFKHPTFQGPTSSAYNFGVARSSLQNMGITGPEDAVSEGVLTIDGSLSGSPRAQSAVLSTAKDPIWALNKNEALRLCRVYEEEMGLMYPVLDIQEVSRYASLFFGFMDAATRSGFVPKASPAPDAMNDEEADVLRLVLAISMVTEVGGQSQMGERLFQTVSRSPENRLLGSVDLRTIRVLTLTAMYHFQRDDESLSWRVIGLAARLCLELGLHRSTTYPKMFPEKEERAAAIKLFWSIYVLDRRWSFGTGMSFALQDADIDPALPKPDDNSPYLTAMIAYSLIGSKVWRSIASGDPDAIRDNHFSKEDVSYLDYQVITWHRSIPETLRYIHPNSPEYAAASQQSPSDPNSINEAGGRALYRLRVVLYLRANQMRILIYRPVLHSATSILSSSSSECAQTVIDVAKDSIRVLTHVNETSDIYRTQQMCFNYFLISALAVLFLAVSHAPAQFSESCREEFYMALNLVRGLSANSYVSKRLWRTIRGLKEVGPKLGLLPTDVDNGSTVAGASTGNRQIQHHRTQSQPHMHDAHSSAAMAMAGLAGHPVDESVFFAAHQGGNIGKGDVSQKIYTSPNGMANELTTMFEAAGGYPALMGTMGNAFGDSVIVNDPVKLRTGVTSEFGVGMAWGNEDELSRIMRDLF